MDEKKEFEKIMAEATTIALASSVDNVPNVRILNFIYSENEKTLYFQSKQGDQKENEFIKTIFDVQDTCLLKKCHFTKNSSSKMVIQWIYMKYIFQKLCFSRPRQICANRIVNILP